MFSAAQNKAPIATLDCLSCKMRAQKNQTVECVDTLQKNRREEVKKAVNLGKTQRRKRREKQADLMLELSRRQEAKQQERVTSEKINQEKLEKVTKILSEKAVAELEISSERSLRLLGTQYMWLVLPFCLMTETQKPQSHETDSESSGEMSTESDSDEYESSSTDFVLVEFLGKRVKAYYVGQIQDILDDFEIKSKFLRRADHHKHGTKYEVAYWSLGETYDEAVDYEMTKWALAVDLISSDLTM
ncbi:hypothetical protein GQR58_006256 [Nymphon striatum]|nr:hypothetical protein GQR58_006256 [Nymphon striatum]